jgi:tetratricopeptide (TPR) repeat protein
VLRVTAESPRTQIRQNYHEMVRKFHPDRHMDQPQWSESLHRIMEAINVSYKTLTDENERKKYDEEISLFDFAKKHRESQITAEDCLSKARQALKDQNPGETLIWLRRAVEMDPSSAKYLALLGRALSARAAQRQEATEAFEKSLELDPWNISVRWQLASLYMEMQLPWRARPHFAKVLEIDPENTRALERLRQIDGKDEKKSAGKRSFVDRILHPTSK